MKIGDFAEVTRSYRADELTDFAELAGTSRVDQVPEPLIGALFSYLLGVELPGFGTNYLKQEMHFLKAAPFDTPLTARVEITGLRPEKHLVNLATTCRAADGSLICQGQALVLAKDVRVPVPGA